MTTVPRFLVTGQEPTMTEKERIEQSIENSEQVISAEGAALEIRVFTVPDEIRLSTASAVRREPAAIAE